MNKPDIPQLCDDCLRTDETGSHVRTSRDFHSYKCMGVAIAKCEWVLR